MKALPSLSVPKLYDQDDGALEALVAHFGGGDKQLAGQGGRGRRFVRLRRQGCLSKAVCSRSAMIKLRPRNPVTEMAHPGSLAGSKWFVGRLIAAHASRMRFC